MIQTLDSVSNFQRESVWHENNQTARPSFIGNPSGVVMSSCPWEWRKCPAEARWRGFQNRPAGLHKVRWGVGTMLSEERPVVRQHHRHCCDIKHITRVEYGHVIVRPRGLGVPAFPSAAATSGRSAELFLPISLHPLCPVNSHCL